MARLEMVSVAGKGFTYLLNRRDAHENFSRS